MPELPEAETIKRELEKLIIGKKIRKVDVFHPLVLRQPLSKNAFKRKLEGVRIDCIMRRGKMLIFGLSSGSFLVVHLRMTGQLVYPGDGRTARVRFWLSGGRSLDFNDQRLFGELRIVSDWRAMRFVRQLGPEPFDISPGMFAEMVGRKRGRIKSVLLDQRCIAGIGNLYAAESLFAAGIHPRRRAESLSEQEKKWLLESIQRVLHRAIVFRGSSIAQYVLPSGAKGGFRRHHAVYGRKGDACVLCATPIQRHVFGGRSTYFCPVCQK